MVIFHNYVKLTDGRCTCGYTVHVDFMYIVDFKHCAIYKHISTCIDNVYIIQCTCK